METKARIIRCSSGYYAVMVWDYDKSAWSLWWSGSKRFEDAAKVCDDLLRKG